MSDLCMYKLEDICWDEFDQTDDHIVPHPSNEDETEPVFKGDSCKKPRREVIGVSSHAGDSFSAKFVSQGKGEGSFQSLKTTRNTMLQKESWSHAPEDVFLASCDSDSTKEMTSLASDNTRMTTHCFKSHNVDTTNSGFYADDHVTAVESDSYNYPLGDISQTENALSFLDYDRDYGWPDIGNFEDVDRMFRSCDLTFGLGSIGNGNELSWFSSLHDIEGSEDVLETSFKFSYGSSPFKDTPEQCETSKLKDLHLVNNSNADSRSVHRAPGFQSLEGTEPGAFHCSTVMNRSDANSRSNDELKPKEQETESNHSIQFNNSKFSYAKKSRSGMADIHKKHSKQHNKSEGRRKDGCLEHGNTFHQTSNLQFKDTKFPSGASSHQVFTSPDVPKQNQSMAADSYGYLQNHVPYVHLDYGDLSNQIPVSSTLSGARSESNGPTSSSPKESSYASNQVQSKDSFNDHSFEAPAIKMDEKLKKMQHRQGLNPSYKANHKHIDVLVQSAGCDLKSAQKQVHDLKNELETRSKVEGVSGGIPPEFDSYVPESSCVESGLDDISLEASSFRQLQQVMEKLDIRTKLCIRDSLYRLARSAEQRHSYATLDGSSNGTDASGALIVEGTNNCNSFVDMETDTNPIDRSVAHLLFHRPSDSSVTLAGDALSVKSHGTIHGSTTGPSAIAVKQICHEETPIEEDKTVGDL